MSRTVNGGTPVIHPYARFLVTVGRILFSSIAAFYAFVLFGIALFLEMDTDFDSPDSRTDMGTWGVLLAAGISLIGFVFTTGALAAWITVIPMRKWLMAVTLFGIVAFNVVWALNASGLTELYL